MRGLLQFQGNDSCITSEFRLLEAVREAMARQARRSMRSLSASSCSSLTSLSTMSGSVCSLSSLTSLESFGGFHGDLERDAETGLLFQVQSPQEEAGHALGKRKRKRNTEKERERQVKRKKANPRKRGRPRKERIDRSKMRQASRQIVQSEVPFLDVMSPKDVDKKGNLRKKASKDTKDDMRPKYKALGDAVFDLEAVRSQGVTVVPWDGV